MAGKTMDGRVVAELVKGKVKEQVDFLKRSGVEPQLATILVGDNPGSKVYVRNKHTACAAVGIKSRNIELPSNVPQKQLLETIRQLNQDESTNAILLQLPLPAGLDEVAAISAISAEKDVDGLNPRNLGLLFQRGGRGAKLIPCTPKGVLVLLKYYGVNIAGSHAVVINRSNLLGRPLSQILLNEDATVTVCHSKTKGLERIAREGDILLTGIGRRAEFTVGQSMIKPGAAVVDIGISRVDGKLMGDVDFHSAMQVASFVTPVPGGVGLMTIAMLLYNTLLTASLQSGVALTYNPDELASPESL